MTTSEFVYSILGFIVLILAAILGISTHARAEKGTGHAVGRKHGNSSRLGQYYKFEASDGKTYNAHLSTAGARLTGFFDYIFPEEVEVQYDENNPTNNIVIKKIWKDE